MADITTKFVDAIEVQFLKPIFEDDFPEKGMKAWLTDIQWDSNCDCYELFFDFSDFEKENMKYFKRVYHPNKHTKEIQAETGRSLFTAIEAKMYEPKYSVYFSICTDQRNDVMFVQEIKNYLR